MFIRIERRPCTKGDNRLDSLLYINTVSSLIVTFENHKNVTNNTLSNSIIPLNEQNPLYNVWESEQNSNTWLLNGNTKRSYTSKARTYPINSISVS